ncbi:1-phosphofructokinase [Neisseria perflava]|uniref:1-phosphofructokinase n=1 Tax=Neisseria perflava TaxID=33053 RepID=UPI0020A03758|nr:1-phosphofructokinase [Neisseria perflava]MCP1659230.1 1-phosphofructokinase [Neisseria perflava]MCP1771728.1 1-phosphofructokinase [Neisseria perflava]
MAKFLCITLNPAIDFTVSLDSLRVGEVNRQQSAQSHAAGKGLNVAQVLRDLGHEITVSGFLGRDNAAVFQVHFAAMGFSDRFVYVDGETRTNVKIAEANGRMTDINGKGFAVSAADKAALLALAEELAAAADFVAVSGSLPQQFAPQDLQELLGRLKNTNPHIAVDTSGAALTAAVACNPYLIKPNTDELHESFGGAAGNAAEQAALLADTGAEITHAVVSMGEHGVNWLHDGLCLHASAAKVEVKSTVGAGDTLMAGMLHGLASGFTPEDTLRTAAALAANAVSQVGFRVPDAGRLNELKQSVTIQTESIPS